MATYVGSNWTEVFVHSNNVILDGWPCTAQVRLLMRSEQNTSANTSTIRAKWQKRLISDRATSGYIQSDNSHTYRCNTSHDTGHTMTWTFALGTTNLTTTWQDAGSQNYWGNVQHNDDGTCSVTTSVISGYNYWTSFTGSNFTITLPRIDRYPTAPTTCTQSANNGNYLAAGESTTLNWSGASGVITSYKVQYKWDSGSWTDYTTIQSSSTSGSLTWTCSSTFKSGQKLTWRVCAYNGTLASAYKESNTLEISGKSKLKIDGTWRNGTTWIKIDGTWRRAKRVWIKVNGTWQQSK